MHVLAEHPIERYRQLGALVTVNTDNTMMSGVSLTDEFVSCAVHLGWSHETLAQVALQAFDAGFLPYAERQALRASAERDLARMTSPWPALFLPAGHQADGAA